MVNMDNVRLKDRIRHYRDILCLKAEMNVFE